MSDGFSPAGGLDSLALLQAVVDGALAAVVTMDEDGIVNGWGARAEQTFGWAPADAIGRPLSELIVPPRFRRAHEEGLARYRSTGEGPVLGKVLEVSAVDRSGREFPVELAISPASQVGGSTVFIGFMRDITDRQETARLQAELVERSQAEQRMVRDFAGMAVHELRAPLAVASGYASMMVDGSLGPGPKAWTDAARMVAEKLERLAVLVDDLLMSVRVEGGGIDPRPVDFDLGTVASAATERARGRADLAGAALTCSLPPMPVMVNADPELVGTILDNLLNNALAYGGEPASITLSVAGGDMGRVRVSDAGCGVPPGMREAIFERFVRLSDRAGHEGTGLGLYISRQLAQAQGGTLELEWSEEDVGSTFSLSLPPA